MRRKRQNRSTWFPVLGTATTNQDNPLTSVYTKFQTVELGYQTGLEITPLIPDYTEDPNTQVSTDSTLRDFVEGQTCVIDRIVGKIYCAAEQVAGSGESFATPRTIVACAAIAVLPVDDSGVAITTTGDEVNPLAAENLDKPWMWRRTWCLSNLQGGLPGAADIQFPTNNAAYGSMVDGTHIDTRGVKRVIQRNQRIFLILANQDQTPGEPNENSDIFWAVDLRVLGRMRRARNRSLFT